MGFSSQWESQKRNFSLVMANFQHDSYISASKLPIDKKRQYCYHNFTEFNKLQQISTKG